MTPAHFSAWQNSNVEVMKLLIDKGADIYSLDNDKMTPAHYANENFKFKLSIDQIKQ